MSCAIEIHCGAIVGKTIAEMYIYKKQTMSSTSLYPSLDFMGVHSPSTNIL